MLDLLLAECWTCISGCGECKRVGPASSDHQILCDRHGCDTVPAHHLAASKVQGGPEGEPRLIFDLMSGQIGRSCTGPPSVSPWWTHDLLKHYFPLTKPTGPCPTCPKSNGLLSGSKSPGDESGGDPAKRFFERLYLFFDQLTAPTAADASPLGRCLTASIHKQEPVVQQQMYWPADVPRPPPGVSDRAGDNSLLKRCLMWRL